MCGILYKHNLDGSPVNEAILNQFDKQRARGVEGFGIYDGQHIVKATTEDKILDWLCKKDSPLLLMHHRYPTSTPNTKATAHPFTTGNFFGKTQYILVHNGCIDNALERRAEHVGLGIKYQSYRNHQFNDSEALLWDFALKMERNTPMDEIHGDIAFICVKTINGKLSKLYFGRNAYRPLKFYRNKQGIELSSEGKGNEVTTNKLYSYDYQSKRLTKQAMTFNSWKKWKNNAPYYDSGPYDADYSDDFSVDDAGSWLPPKTRRKLQKYLLKPRVVTTAPILTPDEIDAEWPSLMPTHEEIATAANAYMVKAHGHFEQAYWFVEDDYDKACNKMDTRENVKERFLLETVLSYINDDPEYLDEESVSSLFEAVWQQQHLAVV